MRRYTVILSFILIATPAQAASLRICMADPLPQDTSQIEFTIGTSIVDPDLLPGSTVVEATRCKIIPMPSLQRGTPLLASIRAINFLGEGGPASAPVTFRVPLIPTAIKDVTIQAVTP